MPYYCCRMTSQEESLENIEMYDFPWMTIGLVPGVMFYTGDCYIIDIIDGFMHKRRNSSALAMELRLFCIKPSVSSIWQPLCTQCVLCGYLPVIRMYSSRITSLAQGQPYRIGIWIA